MIYLKQLLVICLLFASSVGFGQKSNHNYSIGDTSIAISALKKAVAFNKVRQYDSSIIILEMGLETLKSIGLLESEYAANLYQFIGFTLINKAQFEQALTAYENSMKIRMNLKGEKNESNICLTTKNIGDCYAELGMFSAAITQYKMVLECNKKEYKPNEPGSLNVYRNMVYTYLDWGKYEDALTTILKMDTIISAYPIADIKSGLYYDLLVNSMKAQIYGLMGDFDNALIFHKKRLSITLDNGSNLEPWQLANAYGDLGIGYKNTGDYEKSLECHYQSLALREKIFGPNHGSKITTLMNLSVTYMEKREWVEALMNGENALDLSKKIRGEDAPENGVLYDNIGICYASLKNYDKAIFNHKKALSILLSNYKDIPADVAIAYFSIGNAFSLNNMPDSAFCYFNKVSTLLSTLSSQNALLAMNDNAIGNVYLALNKMDSAVVHFNNALKICKYAENQSVSSVTSPFDVLDALDGLILCESKKDQYPPRKAEQMIKHVFDLISGLQEKAQSKKAKSEIISKTYQILDHIMELMHDKQDVVDKSNSFSAFDVSERFRGFLLRLAFQQSNAQNFADIPKEVFDQEKKHLRDIANVEKLIQDLLNEGLEKTDSNVLKLSTQLFEIQALHDQFMIELEKKFPEYHRLKYNLSTLPLSALQDELLKPGQTLLEYFVGDSSIYLFLVQPKNYEVIKIKKDTAFNQWVEDLTRNGIYGYYGKKGISQGKSINNFGKAAYQLYETLIAPVKAKLPKNEKLIIIPDGILGYVPFEALLTQKPPRPDAISAYQYLIQDHQISYCYSATLLKEMRDKKHRQEPSQKLLAMAPFFLGKADTLLSKVDSTELLADVALRTRDTLTALPSSGPEVASINKILPGQTFYGKEATLQKFQELASRSRILHLSTHGKADDRLGDYAYLAFGMPNAQGTFDKLYARDLYNLSLNADLVVLSACETGIGKLQRGEGIVSLARAFAYAGAKSIVTTLWKVSDEQSKNLMASFYKYLSKGKEKDEALRLAKLEFLQKNEKKTELLHPFFWASFIGIGDMRGLENSK